MDRLNPWRDDSSDQEVAETIDKIIAAYKTFWHTCVGSDFAISHPGNWFEAIGAAAREVQLAFCNYNPLNEINYGDVAKRYSRYLNGHWDGPLSEAVFALLDMHRHMAAVAEATDWDIEHRTYYIERARDERVDRRDDSLVYEDDNEWMRMSLLYGLSCEQSRLQMRRAQRAAHALAQHEDKLDA